MQDDRVDWVAQLMQVSGSEASVSNATNPPELSGFVNGRSHDVAWEQTLSKAEIVDLVSTWSAVSILPGSEQDDLLHQVRHLLDTTPQLRGHSTVALPYVCSTWTYDRRSTSAGLRVP